ncbi:MAG: hypothetical protein KDA73_11335 [Rhodobacteraceae bacterium]|nr:hypothetical protein [Paracoccaceae bacterium]
MRGLIEAVRLMPEDGRLAIELVGALAGILALADANAPRSGARGARSGSVVAGAGFEPAAFRL